MTFHFDNHITTDLKQEMLKFIKTGNGIPRDEEMYAALRNGEKTSSL